MPIIIAIDGFSGCGKSTLAKSIASALNYKYIDTGAMYRAVTLYFIKNNINTGDKKAVDEALKNITIDFRFNPETLNSDTYLNGENCETEIRSLQIAGEVSNISAISAVRKYLVSVQQKLGKDRGIVMDGRDIGTVVFPDAELKIFMTAEEGVRIRRRLDELQLKGIHGNYDEVRTNLRERDRIDSTRSDSPLRRAEDAVLLDNSNLSKQEQFDWVKKLALDQINLKEVT